MKQEEFERMIKKIDVIPNHGVIEVATEEGIIKYHINSMYYYCKEHGISSPKELSKFERNSFIIKDNQPNLHKIETNFSYLNIRELTQEERSRFIGRENRSV